MGLLGRLLGGGRPPQPGTGGWEPDGLGVEAIDHDEDSYAEHGAAFQVGFTNPHLPGRAIVVAFYPVQHELGDWGVERRVTWLITDEPEAAPWFAESGHDLVNDASINDEADALHWAYQWAHEDIEAGAAMYGTWDGEPFDAGHAG